MKKTVLLLISLLLSVMVYSAARYEVFKLSGDVKLLKEGQWVMAKKYEPLQGTDKVMLGANSSIGIKDNKTMNIYFSSQTGESMVSALIISAKNQSKSTTSLLTGAVTSANGDKEGKFSKIKRRVPGVVNRQLPSSKHDADSVTQPTYRNSFGNTLNDLLCDRIELTKPDSLNMELSVLVAPGDSVVSYMITDYMSKADTMYVNVVRIIPGEAPQLMFDGGVNGENISITDGSELTVDWYPSVYDPSARYLLIVCEEDFNPKNMQGLLDSAFKSSKTEIKQPAYIPTLHWNARTWVINCQLTMDN